MATLVWETVRTVRCERVGEMATLEVQRVYPAEFLPDQPARVRSRRCSLAARCNLLERHTCEWAGTAPGYDPLRAG